MPRHPMAIAAVACNETAAAGERPTPGAGCYLRLSLTIEQIPESRETSRAGILITLQSDVGERRRAVSAPLRAATSESRIRGSAALHLT
jgi:hypothetical protein